jgi:hypothetical protein
VKRALGKRPELRDLRCVIFTATGEGPALAYAELHEFDPRIIAVTFPPDFTAMKGKEIVYPRISEKLRRFFQGINIPVITDRLPFDQLEGVRMHNDEMRIINDVLSVFGGGFSLAVQAVLSACDHGEIAMGERVIAITGDTASVITTSNTRKFLSKDAGLVINEILCKPSNLTISRSPKPQIVDVPSKSFDEKTVTAKVVGLKALSEANPDKPK